MYGLLAGANYFVGHQSSVILSKLLKNVFNYKRFYCSVKGVFGNYTPQQVNVDHWCRSNQLSVNEHSSYQLIKNAFQNRGHLLCQLDPLDLSNFYPNTSHKLSIETTEYQHRLGQILGVNLEEFLSKNNSDIENRKEFIQKQLNIYCGPIGYEISQLISLNEFDWFVERIERNYKLVNETSLFNEDWQQKALHLLLTTEALDHFLAKKFQSVKRYGCEGAETMIIFIQELINQIQESKLQMKTNNNNFNVNEIIIGMAHRGRLNLLVNTLNYPLEALFHKLLGQAEFYSEYSGKPQTNLRQANIIGDVLSHLHTSTECFSMEKKNEDYGKKFDNQKLLKLTLLPNPSHLEVVSPVVCGYVRGKLLRQRSGPYNQFGSKQKNEYCFLPLQIHGDASFSGQGIIMETLALANAQHYTVGGSIHLVINNQIGYTTPGRMHQGRSSLYCTDPVKMIHSPVIHVNGDYPELVAQAARLALDYQQTFNKDIAVNLVCFRRWGHNELDDPTFTNPIMYEHIGKRKSIPEKYADQLQVSQVKKEKIVNEFNKLLNQALANSEKYKPPSISDIMNDNSYWKNIGWASNSRISKWNTSVPENLLKHIGFVSVSSPESFNLHRTLKKVFTERQNKLLNGQNLDWATAELLAIGSLLYQGFDVRISGQDVGRGTFSQRHAMIVDQINNDVHVPLNDLIYYHREDLPWKYENFGQLEVCNSILSEEAVLAYEYGLSLTNSKLLTIWEAQFGDFFNVAQTIVDILVANGETKWMLQSALTLLLPNGYDGAGPEHTSARLERFLQQSNSSETEIDSDNVNWSIVYPTTPAQYFHLLRRQMLRPYRKPLVVMSPKLLLRHPRCVSMLTEMTGHNAHFFNVLDDPKFDDSTNRYQTKSIDTISPIYSVHSIIFCSGKHYYTLEKEREERMHLNDKSIAIVRLEELCPFPALELALILKRYPNAKKLIWSQEEHQNMGGWSFISTRFRNILKINNLKYAGRGPLEASAVGIQQLHQNEMKQVVKETFDLING